MLTIVTCNVLKDYNLGGPSILLGMDALLKRVFGNGYTIINLEVISEKKQMQDVGISTYYHKILELKNPLAIVSNDDASLNVFSLCNLIKEADLVIDLNGICFCDNFFSENPPKWKFLFSTINYYFVACCAKFLLGKKIIKNSASFGPINISYNKWAANFMLNRVFDVVIAREEKSKDALHPYCDNTILAPDIANLMPYNENLATDVNKVCISVSQEIKRQWSSKDSYIECLKTLCKHIMRQYHKRIVLVPNESYPGVENDVDVAELLWKELDFSENITILPVQKMTAIDIKNEIASSYLLIASRYHSCVAGLSSAVPTLVIGWHYKYDELLSLYKQSKWQLSHKQCNIDELVSLFDEFIEKRDENKIIISREKKNVISTLITQGRKMFIEAGIEIE